MFKKLTYIIALALVASGSIVLVSFKSMPAGGGVQLDAQQAQKAFILLNKVRHDPNSYSERFGFSLKGISPKPELNWDDSLAAVAGRKAMSMASRGYFGHVDPDGNGMNYYINKADYALTDEQTKHKKNSDFEALEGGSPSAEVAIKNIIIDKDKLGDDGRKLLLGIGDFNGALVDVGIGYVHGGSSKYASYTVVIIAKRAHPKASHASFGN
jgi:uncharacterized protein YkwD